MRTGTIKVLPNGKHQVVTRITKEFVWLINPAYGKCSRARQRGLSRRVARSEVEAMPTYYRNDLHRIMEQPKSFWKRK